MVNLASWIASQQTEMTIDIKTEYLRQQLQKQTALIPSWAYWANAKPIRNCCESISRTNCCNCGASLKGKYRCEYCDTVNL